MRVIAVISILVAQVSAFQSSKSLLPCRLPSSTLLREKSDKFDHIDHDQAMIDFTRHSAFQPFVEVTRSLSSSSSKRSSSPSLVSDQSSPPRGGAGSLSLAPIVAALLLNTWVPAVPSALALSDYNESGGAELAELPPPYIPVIFGLGLLAGVGLLTSSLGNVMDEEASLGLQSGAKAKKEMERGRSSFFKQR